LKREKRYRLKALKTYVLKIAASFPNLAKVMDIHIWEPFRAPNMIII
jgi:hypothetical protein